MSNEIFVSPEGKDAWSGRLPSPNADKSDGPVASIQQAIKNVRQQRMADKFVGSAIVRLRQGRYHSWRAVTIHPEDSHITFAAYEGETPVIDAGMKIDGWREEKVNGKAAWTADASRAIDRIGYFHQLFVNDRRAQRPRLPKKKMFWMESVPETPVDEYHCFAPWQKKQFVARAKDMRNFRNLGDTEMVLLHWWIEERRNISSFDEASRMVTLADDTCMILTDDHNKRYGRYYLENIYEALTEAGEWYLDRQTSQVFYIPRAGETIKDAEVFAAGHEQVLKFAGKPEEKRWVEGVSFQGIVFEHTEWKKPNTSVQATMWMPSGIYLEGARNCAFEDCIIRHMGAWAVEVGQGCHNIRIAGNTITDIGGGGIKVSGSDYWGPLHGRTGNVTITDNEISSLGRVHHSAVGILIAHAGGCSVMHNHIHDLYYTGISCGWVWGFNPSVAHDNRIEKNHIHNLGQGLLNDMGGVYTLGVQPGTTIRGNLIHDITSNGYGGWGIYPDEGSTGITIENNIVYTTSCQPFHLHYGNELNIRNNIWAFGNEGQIAVSRGGDSRHGNTWLYSTGTVLTFERNIVITDNRPVFVGGMDDVTGNLERRCFISDLNLFYDVNQAPLFAVNAGHMMRAKGYDRRFDWAEYLSFGYDAHSIIADPRCADIKRFDFTLGKDSPALALGFKPIDMSDIGPRPREKRY